MLTLRSLTIGAASVLAATLTIRSPGAQPAPRDSAELLDDPAVKAAMSDVQAGEPLTIADQIRFCEVAAPPFMEGARAEALRRAFEQAGLRDVRVDAAGNVLGDRPGRSQRPHVVLSAHLDTVFPEDTNVKVRREGAMLYGPGIGDDCRGLAALVAVARALAHGRVQTGGSITFVATVGEEGLGDLRGVKALFGVGERGRPVPGPIDQFVSIDGTGLGVTNVGVGSVRYRITFRGPGGHSFAAFGTANAIHAMGRAIDKVASLQVPTNPKTTFNVGRVGGGTSVNAIPAEAWMEVDLRSSDAAALLSLERKLFQSIDAAIAEENARWRAPGVVTAAKERVGNRPAGSTPLDSPIVRTAEAVHRVLNLPFSLSESSTDSNIPMSLRIPAITIGAGGRGAAAHAVTESFDTTDAWLGTGRALLLTVALAGR